MGRCCSFCIPGYTLCCTVPLYEVPVTPYFKTAACTTSPENARCYVPAFCRIFSHLCVNENNGLGTPSLPNLNVAVTVDGSETPVIQPSTIFYFDDPFGTAKSMEGAICRIVYTGTSANIGALRGPYFFSLVAASEGCVL